MLTIMGDTIRATLMAVRSQMSSFGAAFLHNRPAENSAVGGKKKGGKKKANLDLTEQVTKCDDGE